MHPSRYGLVAQYRDFATAPAIILAGRGEAAVARRQLRQVEDINQKAVDIGGKRRNKAARPRRLIPAAALVDQNIEMQGREMSENAGVEASVQPRRLPRGAESGIEEGIDPRRSGPMRPLALICLFSLVGCVGSARVEGFAASGPSSFLYSAHTNTVLTANDDGTAERLRRDWIADALQVHAMCRDGYVVDTRRFVPDAEGPFGNGGEILYAGRCLEQPPAPPLPVDGGNERGERG